MAKVEITNKDIVTVERLHDALYEFHGVPIDLHEDYRQLICKMYQSFKHEQNEKTTTIQNPLQRN